jgi:hypothetical protein
MESDLYHSDKKIRHSPKIDMTQLSKSNAAEYATIINNEVFRLAGGASLINPFYFDVNEAGIVSFTDIALRHANITHKFRTYRQGGTLWRDDKADELSTELRVILDACGFWDQGHQDVKCLRDGLLHGQTMSPGDMVENLTEVIVGVKDTLTAFDSALDEVKECRSLYARPEVLRRLTTRGRALYANYDTGKLTGRTLVGWSQMTDFGTAKEVAKFFEEVSNGYRRLIGFRQTVEDKARVPDNSNNI